MIRDRWLHGSVGAEEGESHPPEQALGCDGAETYRKQRMPDRCQRWGLEARMKERRKEG